MKSTGRVQLTITVSDEAKTKETILLYILESRPSVDSETTLNKAMTAGALIGIFQCAQVSVKVRNCVDPVVESVSLTGVNENSSKVLSDGMSYVFDKTTGLLNILFQQAEKVQTGSYTFNVAANLAGGVGSVVKLKVKVVDKEVKTIAVSAKGSIDIFDRENSCIVVMPKLTGLTGTIESLKLVGQDAHLFSASMKNNEGQVVIRAKNGVSYITKYAYKVSVEYTLKSGNRTYKMPTKEITVKVKQGKVSVASGLRNNRLYQTADNTVSIDLTALNVKSRVMEITDVSAVEAKNMQNAFVVVYDEISHCYQLFIGDGTKVKKIRFIL